MNKRPALIALLCAPVLTAVLTLLLYIHPHDDWMFIIVLLAMVIGVPITAFTFVDRFLKNGTSKKITKLFVALGAYFLIPILNAAFCLLCDEIVYSVSISGRVFLLNMRCGFYWTTFCGLFIVGNSVLKRAFPNKLWFKMVFASEGLAILAFLMLFTHYAAEPIASRLGGFGGMLIGIFLFPFSGFAVMIYSYYYGKFMKKRLWALKLAVWLLGVFAAAFVALSIIQTPHRMPIYNFGDVIFWVVSSIIIFAPSVIGFVVGCPESENQELANQELANQEPEFN